MDVNWNLLNRAEGNFQNALATGLQMGAQYKANRQDEERRNALTAYATNPDAPGSFEGLAKVDPGMAIQARGQQQQQAAQQQEQRRADLPLITKLLEHSQDEGSYQQARATAQQYGIDVSTLPPNFDPAWRDQQLGTLRALQSPQAQEALSTAGRVAADMGYRPGTPEYSAKVTELWQAEQSRILALQPGGGAASVNPVTGVAQMVIAPNMGGATAGAPVGGSQLPPGFTLDQGGPASAPGTFHP